MNLKEPSIAVGQRLRDFFNKRLKEAGVKVIYNCEVKKLERQDGKIAINVNGQLELFDYVVNATGFQALLPKEPSLPFNIDVVYQPCLALIYRDKQSTARPFSFIVMDGWFPCVMPYGDPIMANGKPYRNYILTHGKWTIMGSFKTANEAQELLRRLDDDFVKDNVKSSCEREIKRFWPEFGERFEYIGWQGDVLAKISTNTEFRSAVTFANDNIIYIVPGKVSNVFDVEREVLSIINKQNIINDGCYQYVRGGVLHEAMFEIAEKIEDKERNTCMLQSYKELKMKAEQSKKNIPLAKNNDNTSSYMPRFFKALFTQRGNVEINPNMITSLHWKLTFPIMRAKL